MTVIGQQFEIVSISCRNIHFVGIGKPIGAYSFYDVRSSRLSEKYKLPIRKSCLLSRKNTRNVRFSTGYIFKKSYKIT